MKKYRIEAVLVLPEGAEGLPLPQVFYQKLLNESHDIREITVRRVGRSHRTNYATIGSGRCAAKGKLLYVSGNLTQAPQETFKYLHLVATSTEVFFLLNDTAGSLPKPNYTLEVEDEK